MLHTEQDGLIRHYQNNLPYLGYGDVRAAGKGMVFWPRCSEQGIQFHSEITKV